MALEKTEMKRSVAKTKAIIASNAPAQPRTANAPTAPNAVATR